MNAKNESNQNIDWWFIYKTPKGTGNKTNKGFQYFYYEDGSSALTLSKFTLDQDEGAIYNTFEEIFSADSNTGYIVYNDEQTDAEKNNGEKGHCKGILAFNKSENSAMFLLHSTPRFPAKGEATLPTEEEDYGQTYLCITLPDYNTANLLADQMLAQQNPQVLIEDSFLSSDITSDEALYQLFHQTNIAETVYPSIVSFNSAGGKAFKMIAKSKKWGQDLWLDLICADLDVDMNVESWRRGTVNKSEQINIPEEVEDVMVMDCTAIGQPTFNWSYTKDHSKWGAAEQKDIDAGKGAWVCIADINRMVSQEKRGGGGLCFEEPNLWKALNSMEAKIQDEGE